MHTRLAIGGPMHMTHLNESTQSVLAKRHRGVLCVKDPTGARKEFYCVEEIHNPANRRILFVFVHNSWGEAEIAEVAESLCVLLFHRNGAPRGTYEFGAPRGRRVDNDD